MATGQINYTSFIVLLKIHKGQSVSGLAFCTSWVSLTVYRFCEGTGRYGTVYTGVAYLMVAPIGMMIAGRHLVRPIGQKNRPVR